MLKRLLLLIALLVASGCDHWMEKLAPETTGFARHCFDLLQKHDFAALETLAAPGLRTSDFHDRLAELAAQIPAEVPMSSDAVTFNVSTDNGYTTATVGMVYQFPSGWLEFDIAAEGSDSLALTAIGLHQTKARTTALGMTPFFLALPPVAFVFGLIGAIAYRRRIERREALQTTPAMQERRREWSIVLDDARTPWLCRFLGIRSIDLITALDPEECKQRLRDSLEGELALFRLGKPRSGFQGRVGKSHFRISRKESILLASRYQTFLYGSFRPDGAGTHLHCSLSPQRLLFGLIGVFLLFAWTAFPVVAIGHGGLGALTLLSLLGPLMITAFMAIGFAVNRRRVLKEGPVLLDFLSQTLEATEVPVLRTGSVERMVQR